MSKGRPKGPRAKVRRVLFIEGHPDGLYRDAVDVSYTLTWKNKTFSLGKCGEEMAKALREMNTYAQVNRIEKPKRRLEISGITYGNHAKVNIKRVGRNTHIIVNAADENGLNEGVARIGRELKEKELDIIERCHWSCDYDPGSKTAKAAPKAAPAPAPTPTPKPKGIPVNLADKPGRYFCEVHGREVLVPRECDYCIVKKQCGEFEEFKKKMEAKDAVGQK